MYHINNADAVSTAYGENPAKRMARTTSMVLTALFTAIIVLMAFTPLGYIPLGVINATIIHIPVIIGALYLGPKRGAFLGFVFGLTSFIKNTLMPATLSAFVFSPVLAATAIGPSGILKSTIICFVPRILVGIVPYYCYLLVKKAMEKKSLRILFELIISALVFFGVSAFIKRAASQTAVSYIAGAAAGIFVFIIFSIVSVKGSGKAMPYAYAGLSGALTNTLLVMPMIYIFYHNAYARALSINPDAVLSVIGGVIAFNGVIEAVVAAVIVALIASSINGVSRIRH
jgi:uncharacterized membrane protein